MPRRVEDIIRTDRRSIRNVSVKESEKIPEKKPAARVRPASKPDIEDMSPVRKTRTSSAIRLPKIVQEPPIGRTGRKGRGGRRLWLLIVIGVVAVVGFTAFIASSYFSRATFSIVPVTFPVSVNNVTIVATGTSTPGYIRYDVARYNGTASTSIPASDGPIISTKSTGTVTLYNYFATEGQRLIAGTRLSNDNGMIYRLTSSIFIPGYKASGGSIIPGTIRTTVVAESAGAQYDLGRNEGSGTLKVVAYKGAPRYDSIYAKAYSDIAGGFSGTKKTVDKSLLASTTENLQKALQKTLESQALANVPPGSVTYNTAYTISFSQPKIGGEAAKSATVTLTATLYSVLFKKSELVAKLAGSQNVGRFGKWPFSSDGLENLKFSITNPGTFKPTAGNALIARLNGNMQLRGIVPTDELRQKLAGLSLAQTRAVFGSYSSVIDISKSLGELFPSWASSVPKDENRITVVVKD